MDTSEATAAPLMELRGVQKTYRDSTLEVHALRDVDFEVARGELVVIMGPSGSGKSTLLHILGCLDHPTAGTYRFDGRDTNGLADVELARLRNRRIGFVFQSFHLLQNETALENVTLPLLYAGAADAEERGREALRAVGLEQRMQHRPGQLSGGEQQRVAIARALVKRPDVVLADEPTGNLDTAVGHQIIELFQTMHAEGLTVLMITHNPELARIGQRTLFLRDGQLYQQDVTAPPHP